MDVFASSEWLCDAAIAAAHELGVFSRVPRLSGHRMRALVDVLVALGFVTRQGDRVEVVRVPPRPEVPASGWGQLADVIRKDRPLPVPGGDIERRMHRHLLEAGAAAADELASLLGDGNLLDIGGGAGAYTAAFLATHDAACATLVDHDEIVAIAREQLAGFGDRARFIAGDARSVLLGEGYGVALLANVLHLHGAKTCAALCELAAHALAPGGRLVVKDLRVDEGRQGPLEGLLFALNMALYTSDGTVYEGSRIRTWLVRAGLIDVEEYGLASSPGSIVVIGTKPADDAVARRLDSKLSRVGKIAWLELEAAGMLRAGALPTRLRFPAPLRRMLARTPEAERHYTEVMPRMRVAQIAGAAEPAATLFHTELDWARLPRLSRALDRLFELVVTAGVDPERALGVATAAQLRAPTYAALYTRTHYGACMPLLYGYPADLAYFTSRGGDVHATIDRYLVAPLVHELCHFGRDREALPLHLDECVAGWLGVRVWPELAYPETDEDDAIFAAPWLAQVGQAIARTFGVATLVRGQSGIATWRALLPASFLDAAQRLSADQPRALHLLADTFAPRPWLALALAHPLPEDDAFDRAIVEDGVRAMCLDNVQLAGSFRARSRIPEAAIEIDDAGMTTPRRGIDTVDPWYWLPPTVGARIGKGATLQLRDLRAISAAADAIHAGLRSHDEDGFSLVLR